MFIQQRKGRIIFSPSYLLFCLDCDLPPYLLTQSGLCTEPSPSYQFYRPPCELSTYSYQFLDFRPWAGIKVLRRSVRFPLHFSLLSPERILLLYKCFPLLRAGSKRANLRMLWFMFPIAWNKHELNTDRAVQWSRWDAARRKAAALPFLSLIIKESEPLSVP